MAWEIEIIEDDEDVQGEAWRSNLTPLEQEDVEGHLTTAWAVHVAKGADKDAERRAFQLQVPERDLTGETLEYADTEGRRTKVRFVGEIDDGEGQRMLC